ncbi:MAG: fibronectin type III domain-containing protein [Treponema sp.]|nr:fibronectin type III domain-containing protein [Treponema sp.]
MDFKRTLLLTTIFLTTNFCIGKICAQEISEFESEKNYYIEKDSRQRTKFVQRLSWQEIPNVEHYEVEIQKFSGDSNFPSADSKDDWKTVFKETVPQNFVEVSLESGIYRFQISATNLLDRGKKSAWERFVVLKAQMPKINSVHPKKVYVNSTKNENGIFTLRGENFLEQTLFALHAAEGEGSEQEILQGEILDISPDGKTARVQFDSEKIQEGSYKILAKNPGDFSDFSETLFAKTKFISFESVQLGASYFLPVSVYDGTLEKYMDSKISLFNAGADIALLFLVKNKMHFGAGLKANYSRISAQPEFYELSGNYLTAMFNLIYQAHIIPQKLVLDFHASVGVAMIFDTHFDYKIVEFSSPNLNSAGLAFGGGFALQYYPGKAKHFFVAAGADFVHAEFMDMSCGTFSPQISFGVKF